MNQNKDKTIIEEEIKYAIERSKATNSLFIRRKNPTIFLLQICNLANLKHLDLVGNKLKNIPPQIGNLVNLKSLNLSTNNIHILRVTPNINSAREAIKWVNWSIDPEEFDTET